MFEKKIFYVMALRRSRWRQRKLIFQYFAVLLYHFSESETPWLINKFLFSAFFNFLSNGILIIKFDALTTRKIIFKQHIKYVSVKLLFFVVFFKLTKC